MKRSTRIVRGLVHALGFELTRLQPAQYPPHVDILGQRAFQDIQRLLVPENQPVIFDVGANSGQSVRTFRNKFPLCFIHSFEPSPVVYQLLRENVKTDERVLTNNVAVGAARGRKTFLQHAQSEMSSFLPLGKMGWGQVEAETVVEVLPLDDYCSANDVAFINLLKIDTQGYELEVLRGCERLFREDRIQMIYLEINFAELYIGLPSLDEIYRFLTDHNFGLVSFYEFAHQGHLASWSDALFLNRKFQRPLESSTN